MQTKDLMNRIREYEAQITYAVKTNEKEIPRVKDLINRLAEYSLDVEDKDLEVRLARLKEQVEKLQADNLSSETLNSIRQEVSDIRNTLLKRYQERLVAYENRYDVL